MLSWPIAIRLIIRNWIDRYRKGIGLSRNDDLNEVNPLLRVRRQSRLRAVTLNNILQPRYGLTSFSAFQFTSLQSVNPPNPTSLIN